MKLHSFASIVFASLILQGCASGPSFSSKVAALDVYPDNRVVFSVRTSSSAEISRVWSSDANVLALGLRTRMINAKDIASLDAYPTADRQLPLRLVIRLRNGETIQQSLAGWGKDVEWLACTPAKVCEYLDRTPMQVKFPSFPQLLTVATDTQLGREAELIAEGRRTIATTEYRGFYDTSTALPDSARISMVFRSEFKPTDVKAELAPFVAARLSTLECEKKAYKRNSQERKEFEDKALRENPSQATVKALQQAAANRSDWGERFEVQAGCRANNPSPWEKNALN